jgi:hypothetical protein
MLAAVCTAGTTLRAILFWLKKYGVAGNHEYGEDEHMS